MGAWVGKGGHYKICLFVRQYGIRSKWFCGKKSWEIVGIDTRIWLAVLGCAVNGSGGSFTWRWGRGSPINQPYGDLTKKPICNSPHQFVSIRLPKMEEDEMSVT